MEKSEAEAILGLRAPYDVRALKEGWRKLVKAWHPDRNSDPRATAMTQAINAAFLFLKEKLDEVAGATPLDDAAQDAETLDPLERVVAQAVDQRSRDGWLWVRLKGRPSKRVLDAIQGAWRWVASRHSKGKAALGYERSAADDRSATEILADLVATLEKAGADVLQEFLARLG